MSSLLSPARVRAPRGAAAAVGRARLALVPSRRPRAPRAPFAVLVLAILGAGVAGLLMFNTHMQQSSFRASELKDEAAALNARQQALEMRLERLRDPQRLAAKGRSLGLVAPPNPAFVSLRDGRVVGEPEPAASGDSVKITPRAARLPAPLNPEPLVVKVREPAAGADAAATGRASRAEPARQGRNGRGGSQGPNSTDQEARR